MDEHTNGFAGRIRWSVSAEETTRLRFDDADFIAACNAGEDEPLTKGLRAVLDRDPASVDFSDYIEDGVYLDALMGITGKEEDRAYNAAQEGTTKHNSQVNVVRANEFIFASWVIGVGADHGSVPADLSSKHRPNREAAFGALPVGLRKALIARLRVHTEKQSAPALRDPLLSRSTREKD